VSARLPYGVEVSEDGKTQGHCRGLPQPHRSAGEQEHGGKAAQGVSEGTSPTNGVGAIPLVSSYVAPSRRGDDSRRAY
jgi:hypothetical protein